MVLFIVHGLVWPHDGGTVGGTYKHLVSEHGGRQSVDPLLSDVKILVYRLGAAAHGG